MNQSVLLEKNDPAAKSEVNLPLFHLGNKQPVKKPIADVRRISSMDLLKGQILQRFNDLNVNKDVKKKNAKDSSENEESESDGDSG